MKIELKLIPLTLEKAKTLRHGNSVYVTNGNTGSFIRFKVNGKVQRWKREPDRIKIPIKHGMYTFTYLTNQNLNLFEIEDESENNG